MEQSTNTSTLVLKNFSKKLANCTQNVPLYRLLDYFDNGMYGYTAEEDFDEVITNDYVFADDIATCITHIKKIIKDPHIFLKKERVIQNVSVANKIDNEALMDNYKDPKHWTNPEGKDPEPEYVHSYVNEDTFAIYENRFITAFIDLLIDRVTKKLHYLKNKLTTVNKILSEEDASEFGVGYNAESYIDLVQREPKELPVVVSVKKPITRIFALLTKDKKDLVNLQSTPFYIECKKAGKFDINAVNLTNILMHDFEYNYCYLFFIKYIRKDHMVTTESQAYYGFALINLIKAITSLGFTYEEESSIFASSKAHIKFETLQFSGELLGLELTQCKNRDILLTLTCNASRSKASYLIKIMHSSEAYAQINVPAFCDMFATQDIDKQYLFGNVISNIRVEKDNAVYVEPCDAAVVERLRTFLKKFMLIVEGSTFIHTRICPICGAGAISPDDTDCFCSMCECLYHNFGYGGKEYVWVKRLPKETKKLEPKPKANVEPAPTVAAPASTEAPAAASPAATQSPVAEKKKPGKKFLILKM